MPYKDPEKRRAASRETMRRRRARNKAAGVKPLPPTDEQKQKQREIQARFRERRKAAGIPSYVSTEEERRKNREKRRRYRAAAREAGITRPSDDWAATNPERHRENTSRWRAANPELAQQLTRNSQAVRRSTPWGKINNRVWTIIHDGVTAGSTRWGKYNIALRYTWLELRQHIEAQFVEGMTWQNWGPVWELDHVRPLWAFRYETIDDPLFREAWALSNLRPLPRRVNRAKRNLLDWPR